MIYNENIHLSTTDRIHKFLINTPENTLTRWAINKIDYYNVNQIINIDLRVAQRSKIIYALAMPILALLDTFGCIGKALFHMVVLDPKKSAYDCLGCLKSIQLFFTTIPFTFVAVTNPRKYYKTQREWEKLIRSRIKTEANNFLKTATKKPSSSTESVKVEALHTFLKTHIEKNVRDVDTKNFLIEISETIKDQIPTNQPDKLDLLLDTYIKFYSKIFVCCSTNQIKLDINNRSLKRIFKSIIKYRNPTDRINLILNVLSNLKSNPKVFANLNATTRDQDMIPIYLAHQITSDKEDISNFSKMVRSSAFKQKVTLGKLINCMYSLLECNIMKSDKKKLLHYLIQCHNDDKAILEENSKRKHEYQNAPKKHLSKKARATKQKNIDGKKKKLEQAKNKINELEKSDSKETKNQISQLKKNCEGYENDIKKIEEELNETPEGSQVKVEPPKLGVAHHLDDGITALSIIALIDSKEVVNNIIDNIGEKKKFCSLSDPKILQEIFKKTFNISDSFKGNFDNLWQMRAPWALIKFHLRLNKIQNPKDRKEFLEVNKEILMSILKGEYQDLRMSVKNNPHLEKVFKNRPELKEKWLTPPKYKVKDLYPESSSRFENLNVHMIDDVSDHLLIGNDLNTCVNLDGSIGRVQGLLGFIRDGKTQTVAAKSEHDPTTYAETQLQLLWDEANNKPVLFVEVVNQVGKNLSPEDHSLNQALLRYAELYAEQLGVSLVASQRCCIRMPHYKGDAKEYSGKVVSLGSSSPIEYVNAFLRNERRRFSLGKTYEISTFIKGK